ncbi:Nuclear transport factor 2 family protein with RNA binding domain [Hibiscus syriacus]|uniref:Nuclear transport factor 2 family protein with RNA binding domain n=1 Tax=Hibiscus syriacus TaxID=106335 RepID=A0A6A2YRB0_HIBSY|nr:Nuclear transport factor 2 family protein with RNA binding domain [Hibiscus syriacus]
MTSSEQVHAEVAAPTGDVVGNAFVHQYYHILHQSPELVHRFYHDSSKLGRPEESGVMISKWLCLTGVTIEITTVDAQDSHNGGVLVLVTGYLTGNDNLKMKFTESFLAPQDKGYFVLNDTPLSVKSVAVRPLQLEPPPPKYSLSNGDQKLSPISSRNDAVHRGSANKKPLKNPIAGQGRRPSRGRGRAARFTDPVYDTNIDLPPAPKIDMMTLVRGAPDSSSEPTRVMLDETLGPIRRAPIEAEDWLHDTERCMDQLGLDPAKRYLMKHDEEVDTLALDRYRVDRERPRKSFGPTKSSARPGKRTRTSTLQKSTTSSRPVASPPSTVSRGDSLDLPQVLPCDYYGNQHRGECPTQTPARSHVSVQTPTRGRSQGKTSGSASRCYYGYDSSRIISGCEYGIPALSYGGSRVNLDCEYKRVTLKTSDGQIVVLVVSEFPDVFPEELPGLPPDREVEFEIETYLGSTPVFMAPYRMAPKELKGLKEVSFLGYIISVRGIQVDLSKIEATVSWKRPNNVLEAPVLTKHEPGKDFTVYSDTSHSGHGCVLMQEGKKKLNLRQRHWLEPLMDNDCMIDYHQGKANVIADALSRKEITDLSEAHSIPYVMHPGGDKICQNLRERLHGVPLSIISDRDLRFTSRFLKALHEALVRETKDIVRLIRDHLKEAFDRKNSYADQRRKYIQFEVGDQILNRDERVLRNKRIPMVKVQWSNRGPAEATWEIKESIKTQFPHLFTPAGEMSLGRHCTRHHALAVRMVVSCRSRKFLELVQANPNQVLETYLIARQLNPALLDPFNQDEEWRFNSDQAGKSYGCSSGELHMVYGKRAGSRGYTEASLTPEQDLSLALENHIEQSTALPEEGNGPETCNPSENEDGFIEEEAPVAEVVDEFPGDSQMLSDSKPKTEELPKKSYASIERVLKENAVPSSVPTRSLVMYAVKSHGRLGIGASPTAPASASDEQISSNNVTENGYNHDSEAKGPSIYVKGLPLNATPSMLENEFKKFGPIKSDGIQVRNQKGFCFGFVEFEMASSVQSAIEGARWCGNYGGGGRGYSRREFGNRSISRGYSNRGDGYQRGEHMGRNGVRVNRSGEPPFNAAAKNVAPRVSAPA